MIKVKYIDSAGNTQDIELKRLKIQYPGRPRPTKEYEFTYKGIVCRAYLVGSRGTWLGVRYYYTLLQVLEGKRIGETIIKSKCLYEAVRQYIKRLDSQNVR